jgi:hypothetical protein
MDMKRIAILLFLLPLLGCSAKTHVVKFEVTGVQLQYANITKIISVDGNEQKSDQLVQLPWIDSFTAKTGTGVGINAAGIGQDASGIIVTMYVDGVAVKQGSDVGNSPSATAGGKL